ncbi:hypothetical protein, partial [Deinococcus aestuarii]|uniref:hypothetical protein n=1 Tax=Deinococcus aestuarii TaxID=2774531 RepID=UPI001C0C657C
RTRQVSAPPAARRNVLGTSASPAATPLNLPAPTSTAQQVLSLSARKPNEAFTLLRRLAQGGDPDAALAALVRRLLDGVEEGKLEAAFLAGHLKRLQFLSLPEVPDDVRLPGLPDEFLSITRDLWYLTEPWNLDFTPNMAAEVVETLQRFF